MPTVLKLLLLASLNLCAVARADSLYDPAGFRPLLADQRARRVGDNLTVVVTETSSAAARTDVTTQRSSEIGVGVAADSRHHDASLGLQNEFDGGGAVQRSGRLLAQLTVSVTDIAPNGDLWVSGEQVLEINGDRQFIKLEGRVRAADVSDTNTVASSRLADARISYSGSGPLADSQRQGWLARIAAWLGL
ncbi:MAG: flagellar biosynthesis protein FlgH [Pseudoduganella sp.]|jgi:flagellar L-ring protein precursor FlgH|nr:flagellar biosynthesis protein FlgH [Pseudoduganella sp.]